MLESCNTSFQIHFQVGHDEFATLYNLAQAITAPVLAAAPGRTVEVVHLEDEPPEIYDALVADGLVLGDRLEVCARSDRGV